MTIPNSSDQTSDGRRVRSLKTRTSVAEAMLDCLESGVLRPSAREVAQRAGVSTRAVFRHFENMEKLFDEAAQIQLQRIIPNLPPWPTGGSLESRIAGVVKRVTEGLERARPVRQAALLYEPFSPVIREQQKRVRRQVRDGLHQTFMTDLDPLSDSARHRRISIMRSILSDRYWEELRGQEKLSKAAARESIRTLLFRLMQD